MLHFRHICALGCGGEQGALEVKEPLQRCQQPYEKRYQAAMKEYKMQCLFMGVWVREGCSRCRAIYSFSHQWQYSCINIES